jgi:hypothetical protein
MSMPQSVDPPPIDVPSEWERLQGDTYQGRDPENLVTAVVDGHGMVVTIRFAKTIGLRTDAAAEEAVRVAISAAQQRLADAWRELTARLDAVPTADAEPLHGGLELAYEPSEEGRTDDGRA